MQDVLKKEQRLWQIKRNCEKIDKKKDRFKVGELVVIACDSRYYPHQMESAGWIHGKVKRVLSGTGYMVEWPNGYYNIYEASHLLPFLQAITNWEVVFLLEDEDDVD